LVRRVSQAKGSRSGWMASSQGCNSTLPPRRQWRPHERPQCSRALNSYLRATTRGSAAFIAKEASTKRRGQGAWHQGAPRLLRDASRSGPACRAAQGGKKKKLRCLGDGTKLSHVLKQHRSCHVGGWLVHKGARTCLAQSVRERHWSVRSASPSIRRQRQRSPPMRPWRTQRSRGGLSM
jgi:hypothetical protein